MKGGEGTLQVRTLQCRLVVAAYYNAMLSAIAGFSYSCKTLQCFDNVTSVTQLNNIVMFTGVTNPR